jgi:peptidoglycan/xylan/chitin deacetylase (PgdA/CDA1 family)
MINITFPFARIDDLILRQHLLESNFELKFSAKQKAYYSLIRPVIPIQVRRLLQQNYSKRISWKRDFIDDQFVIIVYKSKNSTLHNIYPGGFNTAISLTHDVETAEGMSFIPYVIELEKKYGFQSSWNIVPYKYKIDEGIIQLIREAGHEIGIHGYNHDGKLYYSEKIFNERVPYINKAIQQYNAVGFRSPMVHRNLEWLQRLNIQYDASCFDYDPFQPFPGGTGSIWPFIAGKFVELPYTLPQDHTLFYVLKQRDISIWKNKIDWIVKNNGVVLALTHPDYLKEKNHIKYYEELLQYLKIIRNAWYCMPRELAQWWQQKHSS